MSLPPLRRCALLLLVLLAACSSEDRRDSERSPIRFQAFDDADTNHDGKLDLDECKAVPALEPLVRYFKRIDSDHSGFLSWSEVRAARFPVFREPPLLQRQPQ